MLLPYQVPARAASWISYTVPSYPAMGSQIARRSHETHHGCWILTPGSIHKNLPLQTEPAHCPAKKKLQKPALRGGTVLRKPSI